MLAQVDEQQLRQLQEELDEETVVSLWQEVHETHVAPHLADVRERRAQKDDVGTVIEKLHNADAATQQQAFDTAMQDLIEVFLLFREHPVQAVEKAKRLLRDPYTTAGLLMIFQHDQHIDAEYAREMQNYLQNVIQAAGVALFPEAYAESERREVLDMLPAETAEELISQTDD